MREKESEWVNEREKKHWSLNCRCFLVLRSSSTPDKIKTAKTLKSELSRRPLTWKLCADIVCCFLLLLAYFTSLLSFSFKTFFHSSHPHLFLIVTVLISCSCKAWRKGWVLQPLRKLIFTLLPSFPLSFISNCFQYFGLFVLSSSFKTGATPETQTHTFRMREWMRMEIHVQNAYVCGGWTCHCARREREREIFGINLSDSEIEMWISLSASHVPVARNQNTKNRRKDARESQHKKNTPKLCLASFSRCFLLLLCLFFFLDPRARFREVKVQIVSSSCNYFFLCCVKFFVVDYCRHLWIWRLWEKKKRKK